MTLSWEASSLSPDADGYVIYYYRTDDGTTVNVEKVAGGDTSEHTLEGLLPGTAYTIFIRAYQDILGPTSDTIVVMTNASENTPMIQTSSGAIQLANIEERYIVLDKRA